MPTDTPSTAPQRFRSMADMIEKNTNFGGAFVIAPPENGGDAVETLILDARQDPAQFWQMLLTKCQMMIADLDQKQRQGAAFGRR